MKFQLATPHFHLAPTPRSTLGKPASPGLAAPATWDLPHGAQGCQHGPGSPCLHIQVAFLSWGNKAGRHELQSMCFFTHFPIH